MRKVRGYMGIINNALLEKFGTINDMGKSYTQVLSFEFDPDVEQEQKQDLANLALKNIKERVDLPEGIWLMNCSIRMKNESGCV